MRIHGLVPVSVIGLALLVANGGADEGSRDRRESLGDAIEQFHHARSVPSNLALTQDELTLVRHLIDGERSGQIGAAQVEAMSSRQGIHSRSQVKPELGL